MTNVVLDKVQYVYTDTVATEVVNTSSIETIVVAPKSTEYVLLESQYGVYVEIPVGYTAIQTGIQGPKGAPGDSEENNLYSKRVDFITDNLLYKGEAPVGSPESSPLWRIRRITIGIDSDVTEVWADGNADFDKVWSDRLSLSYT